MKPERGRDRAAATDWFLFRSFVPVDQDGTGRDRHGSSYRTTRRSAFLTCSTLVQAWFHLWMASKTLISGNSQLLWDKCRSSCRPMRTTSSFQARPRSPNAPCFPAIATNSHHRSTLPAAAAFGAALKSSVKVKSLMDSLSRASNLGSFSTASSRAVYCVIAGTLQIVVDALLRLVIGVQLEAGVHANFNEFRYRESA